MKGAIEYPTGEWCGTPLHQFQNYEVVLTPRVVPIERIVALAKTHGAICFHRRIPRGDECEFHFVNNAEGRKAAHAFNRDFIAAWNEVVKNLAPPQAEPVASQC